MSEPVELEQRGDVIVVRLNRPAARNAVDTDMAAAIVEAFSDTIDAGCIVLTGANPAFCAGLDLRNLGTERLVDLPPFIASVAASKAPVIAAVNGAAVTGGFELALACDFIVASTEARFADTHLRVGVYPGPVLVDLPRRVGMARAREMSLTGNFVDADTALRIGLANHVVSPTDLIPFTLDLAHAIAEQDRSMVRAARRDWDETGAMSLAAAHARHRANAEAGGFGAVTSEVFETRRDAVMARANQQLRA